MNIFTSKRRPFVELVDVTSVVLLRWRSSEQRLPKRNTPTSLRCGASLEGSARRKVALYEPFARFALLCINTRVRIRLSAALGPRRDASRLPRTISPGVTFTPAAISNSSVDRSLGVCRLSRLKRTKLLAPIRRCCDTAPRVERTLFFRDSHFQRPSLARLLSGGDVRKRPPRIRAVHWSG